jgi:hypothetical protein
LTGGKPKTSAEKSMIPMLPSKNLLEIKAWISSAHDFSKKIAIGVFKSVFFALFYVR